MIYITNFPLGIFVENFMWSAGMIFVPWTVRHRLVCLEHELQSAALFSNRWPISDSSQVCSEPYDRKPVTVWQHHSVFEHWCLFFFPSSVPDKHIPQLAAERFFCSSLIPPPLCPASSAVLFSRARCVLQVLVVRGLRMLAQHVADKDVLYHFACTCGPAAEPKCYVEMFIVS